MSTVKAKAETFILHYIMVAHSLILVLTCFFVVVVLQGRMRFGWSLWSWFTDILSRWKRMKVSALLLNGDGTTIFMWLILATRKPSRCFSVILSFGLAVGNQPETIQNYAHPLDHALPTYKMTRA